MKEDHRVTFHLLVASGLAKSRKRHGARRVDINCFCLFKELTRVKSLGIIRGEHIASRFVEGVENPSFD